MNLAAIGRVLNFIVRWTLILVPILIVVIAILTLVGPDINAVIERPRSAEEIKRALDELPDAEARWASHGIVNYDVTFSLSSHASCFVGPAVLHFRDARVQNPDVLTNALMPDTDCEAKKWLPGVSFQSLRDALNAFDGERWGLRVEFDPEYGFVSSFNTFVIKGAGGMSVMLSDFHPIEQ
jgi:hypothetical protein